MECYLMFPDLSGFFNLVTNPATAVDISQEQRVDQGGLAKAGLSQDENNEVESFPQWLSVDLVRQGGEADSQTVLVTETDTFLTLLIVL